VPANADTGSGPQVAQGTIRLKNDALESPTETSFGVLEIYFNGTWGSICTEADFFDPTSVCPRCATVGRSIYFTDKEAEVACRTLGFSTGKVISNSNVLNGTTYVQERLPPWVSVVDCDGGEADFLDCLPFRLWNSSDPALREYPEEYGLPPAFLPNRGQSENFDCKPVELLCFAERGNGGGDGAFRGFGSSAKTEFTVQHKCGNFSKCMTET
jgi:hypothetical protein